MTITRRLCDRNRLLALIASMTLGLGVACSGDSRVHSENVGSAEQALEPSPGTLTWTLPGWAEPRRAALVALNELKVNDRARVQTPTPAPADVASLGGAPTNLGVDSVVGSVTSTANVVLRDRAVVSGNLTTAGTLIRQQSAPVLGSITERAPLQSGTLALTLQLGAAGPNIQSSTTPQPAPGRYGVLLVRGGPVRLSSGVYKFDQLMVDPGSELIIDAADGPVIVLVANVFIMQGKAKSPSGGFPEWVVAYAGSSDLFVSTSLDGSVFAPNAKVNLAVGARRHEGTVVAKSIELHQESVYVHHPYPVGEAALRRLFGLSPAPALDCPFKVAQVAVGRNGHDPSSITDDNTPRAIAYAGLNAIGELATPWEDDVNASAVAWGDFDGDGLDELAVGRSAHDGHRLVIYDDVEHAFRQIKLLVDHWGDDFGVRAIAAGDIDNDGLDEIAVGRKGNDGIEIEIYDDAQHDYKFLKDFGIGDRNVNDLEFADADNDGRQELLVARDGRDGGTRIVVIQDASENFSQQSFADWGTSANQRHATAVAVGDLDGDGSNEVAVGRNAGDHGRVLVYRFNATSGQYGAIADFNHGWGAERGVTAMTMADVDGDQNDELIVGRNGCSGCDDGAPRLFVYDTPLSNNAYRTVAELDHGWGSERSVVSLTAADVDGDGFNEILAGRSAGGKGRIIVHDDARENFRVITELGGGWGSDRSALSLATARQLTCQSRRPSPLPESAQAAAGDFALRRANVIRAWLKTFLPTLSAGPNAGENASAFARRVFAEWGTTDDDDPRESNTALHRMLAGAGAIKFGLPEATTLIQAGFADHLNRYIVENVRMFKDTGTHADFDFEMMALLELAYGFANVPHPLQPGAFLLSDAAIEKLFLRQSYGTLEDIVSSETQVLMEDAVFPGIEDGDMVVPYSGNLAYSMKHVGELGFTAPETENHVLMINAWAFLANEWIAQGRRGLPPVIDEPNRYQNANSQLEQFLLAAVGRFLKNGSWETNARAYQSYTLRALQLLASYAPAGSKLRLGATNALDYLAAKYTFQSLHGKRLAPMRRNYDYRGVVGLYENEYVAALFGVLTGATVFDTDPECQGRFCAYRESQPRSFALDAALLDYRVPEAIVDLMLRPDNHDTGFGAWSRMHDRYTERHYLRDRAPRYPVPNALGDQPDLNQEVMNGTEPIEPVSEFYFVTQDYLNSAGGRHERYTGFGPMPDFLSDTLRFGTDFFTKPTSLIGGLDHGYWTDVAGMGQETLVMSHDGFAAETLATRLEDDNRGVYKNFAIGYSTSSLGARVPNHWRIGASSALGDAALSVVDPTSTGSTFVNPDFYVVVGQLPAEQSIPGIGPAAWTFWEIVPRGLFANEQALLDHVLSVNAGNTMSRTGGYEYTLATSGEHLRLNRDFGLGGIPFSAIDGNTAQVAGVHQAGNPSSMPLIDVRQVDDRYRFTGVRYVCGSGDGRVVVVNPFLRQQLVLDSRDHLNPVRQNLTNVVLSSDPCTGAPLPSCGDGVQNGTESGVDCGGGTCPACAAGGTCTASSDCQSGACTAGVCATVAAAVATTLTISEDWPAGYCATLSVTNATSTEATTFSVTLNTNASTIYTSWSATFSATSGTTTITPQSWNAVLLPGETEASIGFCANRAVVGSGALPTVISTNATF